MERKRRLRRILPKRSPVLIEAMGVEGEGTRLFAVMVEHHMEGIVAKRRDAPYSSATRWFKIKNPRYSQAEGRGELFERRNRFSVPKEPQEIT